MLIAAFGACGPAAAWAWMPAPVQFSRTVPLEAGAHAAGGSRSADVRTGRRVDLLGVEWIGARNAKIRLRTRSADGRWSPWGDASATDDGPDPAEGGRGATFSNPIWVGGADRVQLRLSRPVGGLRLRMINTTGSATSADRARTRAEVARRGAFGLRKLPATSARRPPIVPRASWGASRCVPRTTPSYGAVRVAYVHHTESLNGYSRARSAAVVLGVCLFHRNTRGWHDIGYDFLVDRYGTVFEGRAGGIDAPVIGAQAGGFNSESTGISLIGSFTSVAPPRAAMRSLARLLAWKLGVHGVPAVGTTKVTSGGGPDTAFRSGAKVTVNRIAGHRDVDQTSCPGNALYARLPALRREVARLQGPISEVTIAPVTQQSAYGWGVPVSGRLTPPAGDAPGGAAIELRRFDGFADTTIATATTAADGSWSALLPPLPGTAAVRAVFAGDAGRPGVVSDTAYVGITPRVQLGASPGSIPAGGTVTATGSVAPAKGRASVTAYLQLPGGGERRAAARTVRVRNGSFAAALRLDAAGHYRLVASVGADAASGSGSSPPVTVTVTPAAQ